MNDNEKVSRTNYDKSCKVYGINIETLKSNINEIKEIPQIFTDIIQYLIIEPQNSIDKLLSEIQEVNCWIKKINYLIYGINKSVLSLLQIVEKEDYIFFPFSRNNTDDECYFHIENAEYRLITMWDTLAQIYNMFYKMGNPIDKINYKKIFNSKNTKLIDTKKRFNMIDNKVDSMCKKQFVNICCYIREDIKYNKENGNCRGNHKFLSEDRNSFTHRKNPHEFSFLNSNEDKKSFELPEAPLHIISRLIEDYVVLYQYINFILKYYELYFELKGLKKN